MKTKRIWISVAIVAVLVIVIIAVASSSGSSSSAPMNEPEQTAAGTSTVPSDVPKNTGAAYKDGTYTAVGSYMSPGGPDKIGVQLTLANGIVTKASVTPMPGDSESAHYQGLFASGFAAQVVGKPIDSIQLTEVSGSSLTPKGFQDALSQIEAQAQS